MNLSVLLQTLLLQLLLTVLVLTLSADVGMASAQQLLTVSALWLLPGLFAALRAGESGAFYGLVSGLFAALVLGLLLWLLDTRWQAPLMGVLNERALVLMILIAFWSVTGGMIGQIIQLVKQKRAARKARLVDQSS